MPHLCTRAMHGLPCDSGEPGAKAGTEERGLEADEAKETEAASLRALCRRVIEIGRAHYSVDILAFSFDLERVVKALIKAQDYTARLPSAEQLVSSAAGSRGALARQLVENEKVFCARLKQLGLVRFMEGSAEQLYEVRIVKSRALERPCTCIDLLRTGLLCKHGVAVFVALKQGVVKIESSVRLSELRTPEAGASVSAPEAKSSTTTLLRALRSAEREVRDTKAAAAIEVQQLCTAMNQLQMRLDSTASILAATTGGNRGVGTALEILGASETLDRWVLEIGRAQYSIAILAFSFDLDRVVNALIDARRRLGPNVRVIMDRNMFNSNQTKNQRPAAIQMRANGVEVRTGPSGRVHAKVLLTDSVTMFGSTNWTVVSQQNEEWTVAIEPTEACVRFSLGRFNKLWGSCHQLAA